MLGRFFLILLLLTGAMAAALFVTRTGYNVGRSDDLAGVTCLYWLGFGVGRQRHEIADDAARVAFECPLMAQDVRL